MSLTLSGEVADVWVEGREQRRRGSVLKDIAEEFDP
jgi:hypothetical protein